MDKVSYIPRTLVLVVCLLVSLSEVVSIAQAILYIAVRFVFKKSVLIYHFSLNSYSYKALIGW